jgi:glyoxylase-like metal-dependent hydrolase (beta-lactamase superfamily II)
MAMRCLLILAGDRVIVVDTGVGTKSPERFRQIYGISFEQHDLQRSLQEHGIAPFMVTDVILTHLHFDHVGGAVRRTDQGLEPLFPQARHHVQREQWEWALSPSDRDRASYIPDNYLPLRERDLLVFHEGRDELLPGIELLPVHGHTFAQQLPRVSRGGRSLLFCGDLIPMSSHVPAPWIMGYDLQPLVTLREKTGVLASAVKDRDIPFFQHDPFSEAAIATCDDKGFRIEQAGTLEAMAQLQGATGTPQ